MKTFSYTSRDRDGRLQKGTVQVVDRAGAMREVKAMGSVPLAVAEGGGAAGGPPAAAMRYALAVAALVAVACGAAFFMRGKAGPAAGGGEGARVAPAAVVETPVPRPERGPPAASRAAARPDAADTQAAAPAPVEDAGGAAGGGDAPDAPAAEPGRPAPYSSQTEAILSMLVNIRPGTYPPPIPNFPPGEDILEVLGRDIVVYDDDPERLQAYKENVAHVKNSLREYLREGGTAGDFVQYYYSGLLRDFEDYRAAQAEMMRLLREGEDEALGSFMAERNEDFSQRGVRLLALPPAR